jgi:hypothetical protein
MRIGAIPNGMKSDSQQRKQFAPSPSVTISMLNCCLRLPRLILRGKLCRAVVVSNATLGARDRIPHKSCSNGFEKRAGISVGFGRRSFFVGVPLAGELSRFRHSGASTYLALMQLSVCCQLTTVQSLSDGELGLSDLAIADRLQAPW